MFKKKQKERQADLFISFETKMSTNNFENLNSSNLFTEILLQSGQYSIRNNNQQKLIQSDTEQLLVNLAELFAKELVSKSSSTAQARRGHSIELKDVNFVLKHHWPIYDSSAYLDK